MEHALQSINPNYSVVNEFSGLQSDVFPMDCAVYLHDKIVAFVEIDGIFHGTAGGQARRCDLLKEYLYSKNYPGVTLSRLKHWEIDRASSAVAGRNLAHSIVARVEALGFMRSK